MLPHLERVCKVLEDLSGYYHENVRYHVCLTMTQISFGLLRLHTGKPDCDDKFEWEKGLPIKTTLPDQVTEFNRVYLFPQFMTFMKQETNKEVIEKVLECIRDIADEMGPAGVMGHIEMIITSLEALLDKNTPCQTRGKEAMSDGVGGEEDDVEEEHESEEDEDDLDHDEIILGNTTDVMISLARCLTDGFTTYLVRLGPKLVPYLSDEHPKSDKVMAIGCLGEVLKACPSAINVYFNDFL